MSKGRPGLHLVWERTALPLLPSMLPGASLSILQSGPPTHICLCIVYLKESRIQRELQKPLRGEGRGGETKLLSFPSLVGVCKGLLKMKSWIEARSSVLIRLSWSQLAGGCIQRGQAKVAPSYAGATARRLLWGLGGLRFPPSFREAQLAFCSFGCWSASLTACAREEQLQSVLRGRVGRPKGGERCLAKRLDVPPSSMLHVQPAMGLSKGP